MFRLHVLRRVKRVYQDVPVTSEDSVQTTFLRRILFKRPPNPLERLESPKRTRGDDDDHSALLSAYHHDLENVSENLKDGNGVFSGKGMPDMLDSAWLAIKIQDGTLEGETSTEAQSVEPLQKYVDNLLVTVSFPLDEETIQQICSNPHPETAFNVMVRRRRAEVKVSTLSAEQKRELVKAKDKELSTLSNILWSRRHHVRDLTVCVDEKALGCDVQGMMVLSRHDWWCKFLQTKDLARFQRLLQPHPVDLVRFS